MKNKKRPILAVLLLSMLLLLSSCNEQTGSLWHVNINEGLVEAKPFAVSTQDAMDNTAAKGNIYIQQIEDQWTATVIAAIAIGQGDWGGVAFYFPKGWKIESLISSYPDGTDSLRASQAVAWDIGDGESKWGSVVEIGRDKDQIPTSGGTGSVVIHLVMEQEETGTLSFPLLVSVGSELENDIPHWGTESVTVEVEWTNGGEERKF